jgi:hypothetical protein
MAAVQSILLLPNQAPSKGCLHNKERTTFSNLYQVTVKALLQGAQAQEVNFPILGPAFSVCPERLKQRASAPGLVCLNIHTLHEAQARFSNSF